MASKKLLSPSVTIWFIPASGVANYLAPTTTEINAGTNLSCAIVTGYTLNATDSDTDGVKTICDNSNVKTPTYDNYEANMSFLRSDLSVTTAVYAAAFTLFKQAGAKGYFVRRIGKANTATAAVGDIVSVFLVESDWPATVESDNGGPIQIKVPFLAQGQMNLNYSLAA